LHYESNSINKVIIITERILRSSIFIGIILTIAACSSESDEIYSELDAILSTVDKILPLPFIVL